MRKIIMSDRYMNIEGKFRRPDNGELFKLCIEGVPESVVVCVHDARLNSVPCSMCILHDLSSGCQGCLFRCASDPSFIFQSVDTILEDL